MNGELLNIIYWWYNSLFTANNMTYSYRQGLRYFFDGVRNGNLYQYLFEQYGTDRPVYNLSFILTSITFAILIMLLFKLFKWIFNLIFKLFRLN